MVEAPSAALLVAAREGSWLAALTQRPCWKEPNSLPNPQLLPGFLSWKPFLMEAPVSYGKSSSSSSLSHSLLLPPVQLHCLPLSVCVLGVEFPKQSPCGLLLLKPGWDGGDVGHPGSRTPPLWCPV